MTILVKDANGSNVPLLSTGDTTKSIVSGDFMLELSLGNVEGHGVVNKFGANPSITAGTVEDVWGVGGSAPYPTTADITHIQQVVDQVTMRGGTIEVQGLNSAWELMIQNVTLDATATTTAVALTVPLRRVFRMKVLEDVVTDQIIELINVGDTVTYAIIEAGDNQTLMALYTVPVGKTALITNYWLCGVESTNKEAKSIEGRLWTADRGNNYEFQLKHSVATSKGQSLVEHRFLPYMKVNEKTDIKISASPSNEDASVHAGFDIILVDN